MEDQAVDTGVSQEGVEQASGIENENQNQGQDSQGGGASQAVDMERFQRMEQEHGRLATNWQKLEQLANADPAFRRELERAWRGLPPAKETQKPAPEPKAQRPQSNKEIEELKANLKQLQESWQTREQETLKREKFQEVQSETQAVKDRFNASDADMTEFWSRYSQQIQKEAFDAMQRNPGLPPTKAMEMAYARHSNNLQAEYINLMEDRMTEFYGRKLQDRNSPLRGIATPAERAGKNGGVTPTMIERLQNAIKKERDPQKRAEMRVAFARENGFSPEEFFSGRQR